MQSFLQYRRFGRRVAAQYERDRSSAEGLGTSDAVKSTSPSSSNRNAATQTVREDHIHIPDYDSTRDIEKGELSNGSNEPSGTKDHATVDDWNYGQQDASTYELVRATPSGREGLVAEEADHIRRAITAQNRRSLGTTPGPTLTGIDVRDRSTKEGGEGKVFVVGYDGEKDILNPHNWSTWTKVGATVNIAAVGWVVGFASSIDSAVLQQVAKDFGVSEVTKSLATGLFLIGFGVGALFAGPVSETVGRNPVYIMTLSLYMIFIMASSLAPNIGAQLAFRFIAGCFAATPLVCAGGSISDLFDPMERVYAFPIFANAAFMGSIFGPVVGGFVGQSSQVSWRWTEWISLIISGFVLFLVILFQPETYGPVLLKWKAEKLRELTGDDRFRGEIEIRKATFLQRLGRALYRPFLLSFSEPIMILVALYLTLIYIILFTFLDGYNYIFTETYGFTGGITGLSFIGIAIGLCFASLLVPLIYKWAKQDLAKIRSQGGTRFPPESRLVFAMFGAPAIPISMFWMAWTDYSWISYWSPLCASVLFGYGILCVFISSYQYIIDSYETYAASALASATLIRYVVSGAMVEVGIPFYKNLGVHWTLTILGCISALMVSVPYLFFYFGIHIRKRSKYAIA